VRPPSPYFLGSFHTWSTNERLELLVWKVSISENSKNLTLLIDTGSLDIIVNPGLYKRGAQSVDIHSTFTNTYGTTESDGSGTGTVRSTGISSLIKRS
jgi:hypothetical protein